MLKKIYRFALCSFALLRPTSTSSVQALSSKLSHLWQSVLPLKYSVFQGFSLKGRMEIPLFTREKQGGSQCSSCGCLGCCSCGMPTGRSPQGSTSYRRGERGKNPHLSL